jgi:hypothetical protein
MKKRVSSKRRDSFFISIYHTFQQLYHFNIKEKSEFSSIVMLKNGLKKLFLCPNSNKSQAELQKYYQTE